MAKPAALNTSLLRSRLKLKSIQSEGLLRTHHPQAVAFLDAAGIRPGSIRKHASKLLTAGAAAATLILTPGTPQPIRAALPPASDLELISSLDRREELIRQLKNILPPYAGPLDPGQEQQISGLLHQTYGIHAVAELDGNHLNTSYGVVGAEQHLPRFPGDSVYLHGDFIQSGITPGRGAWGYFARSQQDLTPQLEQTEKYYIAAQTLYLPDWSTRLSYLRDWYKYRKVAMVNPKNGKIVIAAIADSGPAAWTGKQFGGSPEVMHYLDMKDGHQRGSALVFFVDDPQNQIPLGPLEYNLEKGPALLLSGQ
jgi:hypothetical protein